MKLILDADIPRSFLPQLQNIGHDVIDARDISKTVLMDEEIFTIACRERRILITRDLDFSNILHYPPQKSSGIIVLRTYLLPKEAAFKILLRALKTPEEQLRGTLIIAQIDRLRFHK